MPTKGKTLTNPENGDSFEFLETAKDTQGARVIMKFTVHSKGPLVPAHLHMLQDETFSVVSGKLTYELNGLVSTISEGHSVTLPKTFPHNHYNLEDTPLVMIHTVEPALDFDYFMENLFGLAIDGKMKKGKAGFLQEIATLKYMDSKSYLAGVPIAVQNLLMNVFGPMARLLGYRGIYKKYTGLEK